MIRVLLTALLLAGLTTPATAARSHPGGLYHATDFGARCNGSSDTHAQISAAIAAARAHGGGTVMLPAGVCRVDLSRGRIVPKSNVVLAGQGIGVTTVLIDDSHGGTDGISNSNGGSTFSALDHFTLRDLTVKGMADTIHTTGGQPVRLSGTNITIERVESRYSRNMGLVVTGSDNVAVRDCVVFRSIADGIAVWGTSDAIITGNRITGANDDAISAHSNDRDAAPVRSGLIIANNTVTESQGISVGGARIASIHGNVLRRVMTYGFHIWGRSRLAQGDTPLLAVQIYGNIVTDVFQRSEPHRRNASHAYLRIGGGPFQKGTLAAVPGEPAPGTGRVAPLYGADGIGTLYARHTNRATTPSPGSLLLDIHDNVFMRTLPAVARVAQWGFATSSGGLWVGDNGDGRGFYDGPISRAALATDGVDVIGPLRKTRIAGNLIDTTGAACIRFPTGAAAHDFDGVVIAGNTCRDYSGYGIALNAATAQRVTITGNSFNADPRFLGEGRGPGGGWKSATARPLGIYAPNASGLVITRNRFANLATADVPGRGAHLLADNLLIGEPAATGFSTANRGIGNWPVMDRGWRFLVVDSDPASATWGQTLFAPPASARAMPQSGIWVAGARVANSAVGRGRPPCGEVVSGWRRVSTGRGNRLDRDWRPETAITTQASRATLADHAAYAVPEWANMALLSVQGGTIGAATITLPSPALVPQLCRIAIVPAGVVSALGVTSAGGGRVLGAPGKMVTGQPFAFVLNGTVWTRAP